MAQWFSVLKQMCLMFKKAIEVEELMVPITLCICFLVTAAMTDVDSKHRKQSPLIV